MRRAAARWLAGAAGGRLAAAILVLAAGTGVAAGGLRIDNRMERWLDPDGPSARAWARFEEDFGSDAFVLVAYGGAADPLAPEALAVAGEVLRALEAAPHVEAVLGPPALHRELFDDADPAALRAEMRGSPFYRRFLLSEDGTTAGLVVATAPMQHPEAPRELVAAVRGAVTPLARAGFDVHVVGPPVLNVALDAASRREAQRSFPVAVALSVALLVRLFRCPRATAVAVIAAAATLALTFGAMALAGRTLDMVTSVLPSLLWVLSLAGAIHVLRRYQAWRAGGAGLREGLVGALEETAWPCTLAALTTALGFASLGAATMAPVRELGAFAAAGLCCSLAANLVLGPTLVRWLRVPAPRARAGAPEGGGRAWRTGRELPFRHPLAVAAGAVLLVAVSLAGIARVRVESDPLAFLPDDAPVARDYEAVARALTGYYALEVVVDVPSGWLDAAFWPAIEAVERRLAAEPGVVRVLSPLDLLRQLQRQVDDAGRYRLPADGAAARALWSELDDRVPTRGFPLLADEGRRLRLAALVNVMPSGRLEAIEAAAHDALASLPAPLAGTVTGIVPRLVEAQRQLVETQVRSFGLAFATVFACLLAGLRSPRLVAVSVPPNLLPILAAVGAMGWAGIALDAATVMMASVALGIAVDDTVHVLAAYRDERGGGGIAPAAAARRAVARVGPAMAITTAAACTGFLALRLSDFLPIRWFGTLSALAMVVALLADAWLVPALLTGLGRRRGA